MSDIKQAIKDAFNEFPETAAESTAAGELWAIVEKHLEGMVIVPEATLNGILLEAGKDKIRLKKIKGKS